MNFFGYIILILIGWDGHIFTTFLLMRHYPTSSRNITGWSTTCTNIHNHITIIVTERLWPMTDWRSNQFGWFWPSDWIGCYRDLLDLKNGTSMASCTDLYLFPMLVVLQLLKNWMRSAEVWDQCVIAIVYMAARTNRRLIDERGRGGSVYFCKNI